MRGWRGDIKTSTLHDPEGVDVVPRAGRLDLGPLVRVRHAAALVSPCASTTRVPALQLVALGDVDTVRVPLG